LNFNFERHLAAFERHLAAFEWHLAAFEWHLAMVADRRPVVDGLDVKGGAIPFFVAVLKLFALNTL
jgi:hypothetical protein